jgi:hypothetical protein
MAAFEDELLIVYARTPEDESCASKSESAPTAPVLANRLLHTADGLSERGEQALSVGETADASSPAVITLAAMGAGRDAPGWLVAFSNADGEIELRQVRVIDGGLEVSDSLLAMGDEDERLTDVSVALGPAVGDARLLGIAAQRGCGVRARVVAFTVRLVAADNGTLSAALATRDIAVGGEASESRPSIAYSSAHDAFVVAYRDPSGLRARVFGRDGAVYGESSYRLLRDIDGGDDELHVTSAPFAVPLSSRSGWYGAVAATQRADDRVLQTVTLSSCR